MAGLASELEPKTEARAGLHHQALLYRDEDEFIAGTAPIVARAVDAGEPVMVVVAPRKINSLRAELGDAATAVKFSDMTRVGRNPSRLISVWRHFADQNRDAPRIHGIGEPVWPDRHEEELTECAHHEALLNRAFGGGPTLNLVCPYDASALDADVLEHALRHHPWVTDATGTRASDSYLDPERMPDPLSDPLSPPPPGAERFTFSKGGDLPAVRGFAQDSAARAALEPRRIADLVFAINELATNSLVHGAGSGTLYAWERPGALVFEVQDLGRIRDPMVGRAKPPPDQNRGRGMWLVNEFCDLVQVRSGPDGSRVRLWITTGA